MKYTVLILDNSLEAIELLKLILTNEGYNIITAQTGEDAVKKTDDSVDIIIMDISLQNENGFLVCKELREKTNAPIIVLSSMCSDSEKGIAFSAGADDFMPKPFSYPELGSRIKAHLRRYYVYCGKETKDDGNIIKIKDLTIDLSNHCAVVNNLRVPLTTTEFNILALMARERKKIFTSEEIYTQIWREPYFYNANNTIMVHILKLRKKIEANPKAPEIIKTAWGKGYYID